MNPPFPARLGLGLLLFLPLGARAEPPADPILRYEFNGGSQPKATEAIGSGGSLAEAWMKGADGHPAPLWSLDGEGVTGQPGDYALDLRGATSMGNEGAGGCAVVRHPPLEGMKSFTLTAWIKTTSMPNHGARVFDYSGPKAGFIASFDGGKLALQVNDQGLRSEKIVFPAANGWVFLAITYDSTRETDNVVFYRGADGALASETKTLAHPEAPAENTVGFLCLGNWGAATRPLQGLLDKIAVYGSRADGSGALKTDEIEALFSSVTPAPVAP
ncbi:Concanavalin A-like lectin/glucanases superfamily protein [Verrucomicrobium sp. GAS474]|uniref:LamG domain-containing protein n=1 Tax=Verrucomicrobium sp. GAS474 TaxID=1882831 RepID=UPI00087A67CF|nr:LamG domain-containing protein [Verrucomicrobium sp. GAS474]SDU29295.1 Concanavalin A-like lectin/glucanases superfamily protein [Verrucomicrobium sp. GAS474]